MHVSTLLFTLLPVALAHHYSLEDEIVGEKFFDAFIHEAIDDPTHGRVEYVTESVARSLNLSYASEDHFIMRADHTSRLSAHDPKGRKSVRILSRKSYSHGTVMVADVDHMVRLLHDSAEHLLMFYSPTLLSAQLLPILRLPNGNINGNSIQPVACSSWPALWTVGENWPYGGEIDLLEGVNNMSPNMVSLHTSPGCQQPATRVQKGSPESNECNSFVNYNQGCGVRINNEASYGPPFNAVGGGWYALERTEEEIKAWFWPRNDPTVPADVSIRHHHSRGFPQSPILGGGLLDGISRHHPDTLQVDTSKWGTPDVRFVNEKCDIPSHFKNHKIVINLTFCGDWAGEYFTYLRSGCPGSCIDFVNSNPDAFVDAYWDIRSIRLYNKPEHQENPQPDLFGR